VRDVLKRAVDVVVLETQAPRTHRAAGRQAKRRCRDRFRETAVSTRSHASSATTDRFVPAGSRACSAALDSPRPDRSATQIAQQLSQRGAQSRSARNVILRFRRERGRRGDVRRSTVSVATRTGRRPAISRSSLDDFGTIERRRAPTGHRGARTRRADLRHRLYGDRRPFAGRTRRSHRPPARARSGSRLFSCDDADSDRGGDPLNASPALKDAFYGHNPTVSRSSRRGRAPHADGEDLGDVTSAVFECQRAAGPS